MSENKYNDLLWQAMRTKKGPVLEAMREEASIQFRFFLEQLTQLSTGEELKFLQEESIAGLMRETYIKAYSTCMLAHNISPGLPLLPPEGEQ